MLLSLVQLTSIQPSATCYNSEGPNCNDKRLATNLHSQLKVNILHVCLPPAWCAKSMSQHRAMRVNIFSRKRQGSALSKLMW